MKTFVYKHKKHVSPSYNIMRVGGKYLRTIKFGQIVPHFFETADPFVAQQLDAYMKMDKYLVTAPFMPKPKAPANPKKVVTEIRTEVIKEPETKMYACKHPGCNAEFDAPLKLAGHVRRKHPKLKK